jgi:hypothetical protein
MDLSEEYVASIFRVEKYAKEETSLKADDKHSNRLPKFRILLETGGKSKTASQLLLARP